MEKNENILEPIFSEDPLIPDELLKKIHCGCKSGCTKRCSCRKYGLKCNRFCKSCKGNTCSNSCNFEEIVSLNEDAIRDNQSESNNQDIEISSDDDDLSDSEDSSDEFNNSESDDESIRLQKRWRISLDM